MKFLIVKSSALGDIVQSYPVVQYLRDRFPEAQIDWVVEEAGAELVQNHPEVERTLIVNTKAWRRLSRLSSLISFIKRLRKVKYDVVFDLQGNLKSGLLTWLSRSRSKVGFGKESVAEWPNLLFTHHRFNPLPKKNIREDYLYIVKSYFKDPAPIQLKGIKLRITTAQEALIDAILRNELFCSKKRIMICPGSNWRNKQMTEESIAKLMFQLHKKEPSYFLILWGTEEEYQIALRLQQQFPRNALVLEKLSLAALQRLMDRLDLVVSMDSLPLHLAGTTSVETFAVFGASLAEKYRPLGEKHRVYQGICPYGQKFEKRCPILRSCSTGSCIKDADPKI